MMTTRKTGRRNFVAMSGDGLSQSNPVTKRTSLHFNIGTIGSDLTEELGDAFRAKRFCERWGINPELKRPFSLASSPNSQPSDAIAVEIANEVTIRWADRKNPNYRQEHWIKNSRMFIRHVYKKWLDSNTLLMSHLQWDKQLYDTYAAYLSSCRESGKSPDLLLSSEPRHYAANAEEAVARRRQQVRDYKQRKAAPKKSG